MFAIDVHVNQPPDEVFAALADVGDTPRWYSAVQSAERLDDGPVELGSRFWFQRQLGGATVYNDVSVSEFEPNQVFALSSLSGPTPFTYRYLLEPTADGTLLRLEGRISGEGLTGPLAMLKPLAETFFRRGMVTNLNTLKLLLENPPISQALLRRARPTRGVSP
jgi:hypothetical protein